jgi:Copper resistance protein D
VAFGVEDGVEVLGLDAVEANRCRVLRFRASISFEPTRKVGLKVRLVAVWIESWLAAFRRGEHDHGGNLGRRGLLPLLIFIRPSVLMSATERYRLVRRFSLLATWAVALLIASGIVNTWYMTEGMRHLFGTEYGSLVLAKIALLVIMLGFASVNRFWLTPRLPA